MEKEGRGFFFFLAVGESLGVRKKEGVSKGKRRAIWRRMDCGNFQLRSDAFFGEP